MNEREADLAKGTSQRAPRTASSGAAQKVPSLRQRVEELRALEARLRLGGGPEKIARQHEQGKLTARERIQQLLDPGSEFLEIGLLVAYDQYGGEAPAAGVVTGIGLIQGRPVVLVANDATVKAGAWWPETIKKILRMQEIAMRNRIPIVYLVDSAGVNLPYQSGVFPGQYGAGRIFYYNSIMRRYLKVPQIAAVMGPCIAGGAYLPALSDVILMVEKTSFMGLGGPNLVKGATGQTVDSETLGGAWTHNALSGVAHYRTKDDPECLRKIRDLIALLPSPPPPRLPIAEPRPPLHPPEEIYDILPADHRQAYDMYQILVRLFDGGEITEFQADYAREMICGYARIEGIPVGFLANQRGLIKNPKGGPPRLGGIIYTESAEKSAYFIETCNREGLPILFIQDVSGFMVGPEAEQSGIIRAGARMVEAMATATVPRLVLTINHASGAGYYAMAGQGFDPDFIFSWPTGRMGVMEGETAIYAVLGPQLEKAKETGHMSVELRAALERMHAEYEQTLDARFAAARGFVDALVAPEETRRVLALALRVTLQNPSPHIGPFHIPSLE